MIFEYVVFWFALKSLRELKRFVVKSAQRYPLWLCSGGNPYLEKPAQFSCRNLFSSKNKGLKKNPENITKNATWQCQQTNTEGCSYLTNCALNANIHQVSKYFVLVLLYFVQSWYRCMKFLKVEFQIGIDVCVPWTEFLTLAYKNNL